MQMTRKYVKALADGLPIIEVGYCDLQNLLSCETKLGYTCGVYGWNANVYDAGRAFICTGYRPFGTVSATHQLCEQYDKAARDACHMETNHDVLKIRLKNMIADFVGDVLAQSERR